METVRLTWAEFKALPEYSCSLPTGTTIGKRWKRNEHAYARPHAADCSAPHDRMTTTTFHCRAAGHVMCPECRALKQALKPSWFLGEFVERPGLPADQIGIDWRRIVIRLGAVA